jgi:hypothetical protein
MINGKLGGAMWPRHGLPCGTMLKVGCLKFCGVHEGRTLDLQAYGRVLEKSTQPAHLWVVLNICMCKIVFKFLSMYIRAHLGWGLALITGRGAFPHVTTPQNQGM